MALVPADNTKPRPCSTIGNLRLSWWQIASLVVAFLLSGLLTSHLSDGYLTMFLRIADCPAVPPHPNVVLIKCEHVGSDFYYSGALYLNINKELVQSLQAADVVVIGNSRTQRTFATSTIEQYFARKGLRYFVLSNDGSGFRYIQLIMERLNVKPRIFMINNESFYVDILEDFNKDIVLYPDRFRLQMSAFYYSARAQRWICASSFEWLKNVYCRGENEALWRRVDNGALHFVPDPPGRYPVEVPPETRMPYFDLFMKNARSFLSSTLVKRECVIDYVIPSNIASVDLARRMSAELEVPFIYPKVDGLYTFDRSHLIPESSERWAAAFVSDADRYVDACLKK